MALKFRRGSTAQQSGSLAFGEPYVNTTLGTLVIGGATGDIVLSAGGTGSTGNFGAISGSGLDITGNANIAGNLTLGGAITIGDASADTVNVVASLSSSLIPQTTNAFDLGSASKIWRDLYISTGSIKFVEGNSVVKTLSAATLTALEVATGSSNTSVAALNSFSSSQLTQNTALATISGSLILTASANSVSVANLNTYTSSNDTTNTTQTSRLDQLSTASGSAITRLTALEVETSNLESFTSSINTTIKSKLDTDGVVSGSASNVKTFLLLGNVTNESKATMFTSPEFTGTPIAPTAAANTNSTQIATTAYVQTELTDLIGGANAAFDTLIEISASLASGDSTLNTLVDGKLSKASNLSDLTNTGTARTNLGLAIGTDVQAYNSTLAAVAGGTYSGDDSITTIGTVTAGSVTAILPTGVVSGSSQITAGSTTNFAADVKTRLDANTVVSGSSQITLSSTTGYGSVINQNVLTTSSPTFAGLTINGAITATGDITAFFTSDKRHKNTIQTISNAVLKVKQLNGVTWEWNDDVNEVTKSTPKTGLIAQEVQQVLPQVVIERPDGFLALDYSKMVGLLVEAIKEQQIQIDQLKAQIGSK